MQSKPVPHPFLRWGIRAAAALAAAALAAGTPAGAQAQLSPAVTVAAPSPFLSDWSASSAVVQLIVTNTDTSDVQATVQARLLQGDVLVGTAASPIMVVPGSHTPIPTPKVSVYSGSQVANWTQMQITGSIAAAYRRTGRLPEGSYQLCVAFTNVSTQGRPLPDATACSPFLITYPQPPMLIAPADQQTVVSAYPTFQWTPVVMPGRQVGYLLRVVEVLPGQTPLKAIEADVPVLETVLTTVTTYTYPPTALPLEAGKTYAWRVQAVNSLSTDPGAGRPVGTTVGVGANDGRSEVFTFTKKLLITATHITPAPQPSGPQAKPGYLTTTPMFAATLSGKLDYTFLAGLLPAPKRIKPYEGHQWPGMSYSVDGSPNSGSGGAGGTGASTGGMGNQFGHVTPPPHGDAMAGFPVRQPLAGVPVRLVVRYRSGTAPVTSDEVDAGPKSYDDVGKVIATATTGKDGSFSFHFNDDTPTGQIALHQDVSWGSGEFSNHSEPAGDLFRYYQVEIEDAHYLNPSDELTLPASKMADVGTLVSLVRTYTLRVLVTGQTTHDTIQGARVQVLRFVHPTHQPNGEGDAPPPRKYVGGPIFKGEVIGETTTAADGYATFRRLVKNVGVNDQYVVRVTIDSASDYNYDPLSKTYFNAWNDQSFANGTARDNANFNEDYNPGLLDTLAMALHPRPPTLAGHVYRRDTREAVASGYVVVKRPGGTNAFAKIDSRNPGAFTVANVKDNYTTGDAYDVLAAAPGLKSEAFDTIRVGLGHKWVYEFYLEPDARIQARFVDERGLPVQATITVGAGSAITASPMDVKRMGGAVGPGGATFQIPTAFGVDTVASSGPQKVHVEAEPGYFPIDTSITIARGNNDLHTFVLTSRKHRLRVIVRRGVARGQARGRPSTTPVAGAPVRAYDSDSARANTTRSGIALLEWTSFGTGSPLTRIHIDTPKDSDYVPTDWTCPGRESRTPIDCTVYLEAGTHVSGKVFAGASDSTPVAGARVYLANANRDTVTGADGSYVLHSVSMGFEVMRAAKAGSHLIADSQQVTLRGTAAARVSFHLKDPGAVKLPATLLGFPLEVTRVDTATGGKGALVSGTLLAPASSAFAPTDAVGVQKTVALPFENARLVAPSAGAEVGLPKGDTLVLTNGDLDLRLYDKYTVRQSAPKTGLIVRERGGSGVGAVYGAMEVRPASFSGGGTSTALSFVDPAGKPAPLYVLVPGAAGAAREMVASLAGDGSATAPAGGYNVGAADGGPAHFRLAANSGQSGFPVDADATKSMLRPDGVHFSATVHTDIPGVGDLALPVPDLTLRPAGGGLVPTGTADTLSVKLDQWTLQVDEWSLGDAGIYFGKGQVRAPLLKDKPTSAVVFPFTNMRLLPNAITGGTVQSDAVTLGGVVKLTPQGALQFVREGSGPWKLSALGGTIAGLPGLGPTDRITLDNWSLRSNGYNVFSPQNGTKVRLYNTADFRISSITVADGVVRFPGTIDLLTPPASHIPQVGATIFYSPDATGKPAFGMENANWPEVDLGGAWLLISNAQLDQNGLHAGGHIRVPDNFTVATTFTRTPLTGTNTFGAAAAPNATIKIGEIGLTNVKGGATFASSWTTHFAGHMDIPDQAAGDLSFGVSGTGVDVSTSGFQVHNIGTPFGNVTIRLNAPQQRLEGSLQVDQEIASGAHAHGTAELAISGRPGDRYWYFFTGANIELSSPHLEGTAALLLGNAHLQGDVLTSFSKYSTKGVPPAFYAIDGFFLDGKVVIPIPVCPSGGFDIGVASVAVWCDAWGDVRLGMNFQEHNTYHVGLQSGFDVGAKGGVSLGACISVSGEAKYEQGAEGEYRSDGAWYVLGDASFDLNGNVEYGVGALGVCLSNSSGFHLGLGAEAQMGYNWNTQKGAHFTVYKR